MSFKRVADDFDDFNIQRKRRVNDLLLDNIPSDEAFLMANGKLACVVCHHRPVFDTTAMLTIHRNGKRHMTNALMKLEHAKEDAEIRQRREHEEYLKGSKNREAPLLGITKLNKDLALCSTLQSSPNKNTTVKTSSIGKPVLCNREASGGYLFQEGFSGTSHASLESISNTKQGQDVSNERFFKTRPNSNLVGGNCSIYQSTQISQIQETRDKSQYTCTWTDNTSSPSLVTENHSFSNTQQYTPGKKNKRESMKKRFLSVNPLTQRKVSSQDISIDQQEHSKVEESNSVIHKEPSEYDRLDEKSKALYVSKLRQLGWELGLDGKWEKDKDAEFDSDEDEPPSPKTILHSVH